MSTGAGSPSPPSQGSFRTDIQALRALAVGAVLVFHLWPNRLTGGYVGVDIFFVISGFLITAHLVREIEATGRIRLGAFWARRARRLLPAALLTVSVTAIAVWIWAPVMRWEQFYREMVASILYVQNWRLSADSVDYLAVDNSPSPVQHYWTLSAEEQFYVVLPLVLVLTLWAARSARLDPRRAVIGSVTVLTVASFTLGLVQTTTSPGLAYFSTFTRGWEFLAGALVALLAARCSIPRRTEQLLAGAGATLLVATFVLYDAATMFPGYAALLPVLATIAVIIGGERSFIARAGRWTPVAHVGRVSFAIYLWHFPLIVLLPYVTGHALTTLDKLGIGVATLLLATASTILVEDRIRFSPRLLGRRRPLTVGIATIAMMATALAIVVPGLASARASQARWSELTATLLDDTPPCFGAEALAENRCAENLNAASLFSVEGAVDSNRTECWSALDDLSFNICTLGPSEYTKHLIALGDSHNNSLIDAYEIVARANGWRIDVAGRAGCYWSTMPPANPDKEIVRACTEWRGELTKHLAAETEIDAILVTHARGGRPGEKAAARRWDAAVIEGQSEAWSLRPDRSVPVVALVDVPNLGSGAVECVAGNLKDPRACAVPRAEALAVSDGAAEAAARVHGASAIDLTDLFCTRTSCPAVVGGVLVTRDGHHVTQAYAVSLAPYLGTELQQVLGRD